MSKASHTAKQDRPPSGKARPSAASAAAARRDERLISPGLRKLLIVSCVLFAIGGVALASYRSYVHRQQAELAERCRHAQADGDWPRLEALAREWASWSPNESTPWIYAAEAAEAMHNPVMAAEYLSHIGDDAPLSAFHALGRLQMEVLNQPRAAIETSLRTVALHPRDSETHLRLLFYYAMTCQRSKVIAEAERAIDVGCDTLPTYAYLVSANSLTFNNGYDMNMLWLESEPDSELYYVAAVVHLMANRKLPDLAAAASTGRDKPLMPLEFFDQKVSEALERYPENIELQATRLARLCQAGDVPGVAKALSAAPAATATDARFWRYKGWYHTAHQQWSQAIEAYEKSLALDPLDWSSQHELATALRRSNELERAEEMQRRATLGKELLRAIGLAPRIDLLPDGTMPKIADYLEMCGEDAIGQALRRRLSKTSL